jgi:hypothetical protein
MGLKQLGCKNDDVIASSLLAPLCTQHAQRFKEAQI